MHAQDDRRSSKPLRVHHLVMDGVRTHSYSRMAGAEVQRLGGCCGLARNFDIEKGTTRCRRPSPNSNSYPPWPGWTRTPRSWRMATPAETQLSDLTDRRGDHLAQLLAARLAAEVAARLRN